MAECPHLGRTSAYFDGELPEAEAAEAVDHLATCDDCQGLLRDAATFDAVMSEAAAPAVELHLPAPATDPPVISLAEARAARHKRWPIVAMAVGLAAAAALAVWLKIPRPPGPADRVAISLPAERALEARFSGDRFDHHRPYAPLRGDQVHEAISLDDLAALERHYDTADLIAALAATGDLARASALAAQRTDLDADTDRAALALAGGHPDAALELATRAVATTEAHPDSRNAGPPAAWWNLALAARELDLPRVSRDAFARLAGANEAGWADEARRQIAALDRRIASDHRDPAALRSRAAADQQAGKAGLAKAELAEAALIDGAAASSK